MRRKLFMRGAAVILIIGGALLVYFMRDYFVAGALLIGGVILFIMSFSKRKEQANITTTNFISVFTHFRVGLDSDANVYQALTATLNVTSGALYALLEQLINSLETDHTVTPFITFAKAFKHRFITHIMINVYMLINHGTDAERLWQFNYMFETLVKEFNEEIIVSHESSYERFNLALFLGTGIMIFTLMGSVMSLIGGL